MKVTFTGCTQFISKKKNPSGDQYTLMGIVFKDPSWYGLRSEARMIPNELFDKVKSFKPNSIVDIDEYNGRIMDINLVSER